MLLQDAGVSCHAVVPAAEACRGGSLGCGTLGSVAGSPLNGGHLIFTSSVNSPPANPRILDTREIGDAHGTNYPPIFGLADCAITSVTALALIETLVTATLLGWTTAINCWVTYIWSTICSRTYTVSREQQKSFSPKLRVSSRLTHFLRYQANVLSELRYREHCV